MHIRPPDRLIHSPPAASHRQRRRRKALAWMAGASLLLHLLAILAIWWWRSTPVPQGEVAASDAVPMVFQSAGPQQSSTASANPAPTPSAATGNPDGLPNPPVPTASLEAPSAPATPQPPLPVPPKPQPEAPPAPTPPQQEASLEPPAPQQVSQPPQSEAPPAPPQPAPPPSPPTPQPQQQPPAAVSLEPSDEGEQPIRPFVMPQPPLPLPPLPPAPRPPRPPPRPRATAQGIPRSPSGFPLPQNWSLATGPQSLLSQRGTNAPEPHSGGRSNSDYKITAGADPGEDWGAALRRWVERRLYYPDEAAREGQDGATVVHVVIDKYGRVTHLELADGSGYPLLDMAWMGVWRNATVPPFPPGTRGDSVTLDYTLMYILNHR